MITAGPVGARLPSVRELTRTFGSSSTTVNAVMARLAHEGLLEARPGSGTYITGKAAATAPSGDRSWQSLTLGTRPQPGRSLTALTDSPSPGIISLSHGYPDSSLQPLDLLARATRRAARDPRSWARSPAAGLPELRSWFAADAAVDADDVLVVPGGQAGLAAVVRSLTSPGDAIVVESPTYLGALEVARSSRLTIVPVPSDHHGVQPDLLAAALATSGARLAVLQPRFANPTGVSLARSRRRAVLDAVAEARAFVVEDDFARDLGHDPHIEPPLLADDTDGHVIYLRSLTKSTAPSMRIAGLIARGPVLTRLRHGRLVDDFFVSALLQTAALDVVTSTAWRRSLGVLRRCLATRMQAAVAAASHLPVTVPAVPRGGTSLWLRLPDHADDVELTDAAARVGVAILAGRPWFPAEPPAPYIRISVAAADEAEIATGLDRLAPLLTPDRPAVQRTGG